MVLEATDSNDISPAIRNKLYLGLGRQLKRDEETMDGAILARYAEDKAGNNLFPFLQEWVADTSFAEVVVFERHIAESATYKITEWGWYTQADVYAQFNAWQSPEAKAHADKLLGGARKTAPHPQHRKDKTMKLHKLFRGSIEGQKNSSLHHHGAELKGKLTTPEHGKAVMARIERENNKIPKVQAMDAVNDGNKKT